DYDRSCTKDADCVEVGEGNACTVPCAVACPNTAINRAALSTYEDDQAKTPLGVCLGLICHCPCSGFPRCTLGRCELASCGQ
ncbi:MAG TPA: hypothetical protein VF395_00430, partial [Polyangiaceae bacterium]